jgi:hypothetical protein
MTGYDELKLLRKELRSTLAKAKIKATVQGGRGTGLFWTDVAPKSEEWTQKELKKLREDFGVHVGHPSNTIGMRSHEVATAVYGYRERNFKRKPIYKKLKEEYYQLAEKSNDGGTCVLGAGTIVKKMENQLIFGEKEE